MTDENLEVIEILRKYPQMEKFVTLLEDFGVEQMSKIELVEKKLNLLIKESREERKEFHQELESLKSIIIKRFPEK